MKTKTGTIQIIAIVLALVTLVFISAMWFSHKSILAVDLAQEDLRAYVGIVSKKAPEYAGTALEKGTYQAIYDVGMRGGFRKDTTFSRKNISVDYESLNVSTGVWREYDTITIPTTIELTFDLSKVTEKIVKDTLTRYAPMYNLDVSSYMTAQYTVLRVPCGIEYGADNNKRCLDANITSVLQLNKQYTVSNTKIANAFVFGETYEKISVRLPGMYDLMDNFMRNNFPANTGKDGGTPYNLLSKQLEETTACPAGYNCDWDQNFSITQYCPSQNNCDYSANGFNAKFDYKCVPKLVAPACKRTIRDNLKNSINLIESELNNNTLQLEPYTIKCPAGVPNCETDYNAPVEVYKDTATGQRYKTERFKWTLEPASPNIWNDAIKWDGNSDRYDVLWWAQNPITGTCTLPDGTTFKTDNIATLLTNPERQSTSTGIDINPWQKKTGLVPPYTEEFPEGTACADAFYVNCHEIKQYKTQTGGGSWWNCCGGGGGSCYNGPDPTAWCEMDGYKTDPAHTAFCGASPTGDPYGGKWCSQATTTVHYSDSHGCSCSCPWTSCPSSYGECHSYVDTDPVVTGHVVQTAYTHCDIEYNFYGHFKYRADIDPLLVTLTDESKLIPAEDIYGNDVNTKPTLNAVYQETIREEPHDNDRCLDTESEEGNTNARYYHASDVGKSPCPTNKNAAAPRTDYYTSSPCNTCPDADNTCYPADQQVCVGGSRLEGSEYCTRCAATTCSDGIQNCGETRADCGGPCAPCPTCATLTCTSPAGCCSRAEDGIEECQPPGLDPIGATCRTDCECQSGTCNSTNQCYNPLTGCPAESIAPSFEQAITPADGCPLNLSIGFNAAPGTQFKIEAVYEKGADKIPIEICRTGVNCGIGAAEVSSMNTNCNTSFGYSNYNGYYPWNCSLATPVVPSDHQLTKVKISSLDGSNLKLFGLEINTSRITQPTRCTSCGGTAYWKNAMLWVKSISPGSCVDSSSGSTADILNLLSCEATTGKLYGDTNGNGQVNMSEVFDCCDGTPPAIKLKKPVANCGDYTNFSSPCTFQINVTTDKSARCRYSEDTELSYDSMPNVLDLSFVTKREISKSLTNAIRTYFIGCINRIGVKTPLGSACSLTVNCTA